METERLAREEAERRLSCAHGERDALRSELAKLRDIEEQRETAETCCKHMKLEIATHTSKHAELQRRISDIERELADERNRSAGKEALLQDQQDASSRFEK